MSGREWLRTADELLKQYADVRDRRPVDRAVKSPIADCAEPAVCAHGFDYVV